MLGFMSLTTSAQQKVDTVYVQQVVEEKTFVQKLETSTISTVDEFITKHGPAFSARLGDLWEFSKKTTTSMYEAFVRYLLVKDLSPILLGIFLIFMGWFILNKLKNFSDTWDKLFIDIQLKDNPTEYQSAMVSKTNAWNQVYKSILKILPTWIFYGFTVYVVWQLLPYIYNLGLLLIAPEARVTLEIINLYKSL